MPLIKKIKKNNSQIGVWKTTESLTHLVSLNNKLDISKFKSLNRKRELLSTRLLLNELLPNSKMYYNKYGAPKLKNNNYISISHSKNLVAIIISNRRVGLDIEKINKKPLKLSSKFVSKENLSNLTEERATLIWCCKEAIFKLYEKGNINFISDIRINPFFIKEKGEILAKFKNKDYILHYQKINTHFLVYVCK
tara:strand:+ start:12581 stop:13162 length:582 start_codon:yes stop_codon:yes gene_type:complete